MPFGGSAAHFGQMPLVRAKHALAHQKLNFVHFRTGVSEASLKQDPWVAKVEHFGPSGGALGRSKMHFFGLWPFGPKMGPEPKKVGLLSFLPYDSAQDDPPNRAPGPLRRGVKSVTFFGPQGSACEKRISPSFDTPIF